MVHSCAAYKCRVRYKKESDQSVSFHKFPSDAVLQDRWVHEMKRGKWKPSANSKLCSLHFAESCYDTSPWSSQKRLKPDAIPTIFDFPEHLMEKTIPRRFPRKPCLTREGTKSIIIELPGSSLEEPKTPEVPTIKKRKFYVGDYLKDESLKDLQFSDFAHFVKITKYIIEKKNKQLRILRQELGRTKEKMKTLQNMVIDLKEKTLTQPA